MIKFEKNTLLLENIVKWSKKVIITGDVSKPRTDDNGIIIMGIYYFLLNDDSLNQ